jgi:uncharacterized protein YndB with AHSA1/START domain
VPRLDANHRRSTAACARGLGSFEEVSIAGTTGSTGIVGSLRRDGAVGVVRMEGRFATTADDLWSALTVPARLARWVVEVEGDLRAGGALQLAFTSGWAGPGRIGVCDPTARLQITSGDGDDVTQIEALIAPEGGGARLVLEERGLPAGGLAAHGAGWQVHMEDLGAHLAGRDASDWPVRSRALLPGYTALDRALDEHERG